MELYQSAAPWLRILGMNALNRVGAKLKKTWFLVQFHLRFPKTVGGGASVSPLPMGTITLNGIRICYFSKDFKLALERWL